MSAHSSRLSARLVRTWLMLVLLAVGVLARASGPAPDPQAAKYEVRFMEGMIEHHMMAIHMSELCLQRATHAELTSLCQQIITAQQAEIQQMQLWLAMWYGVAGHHPHMPPGHEQRMEKLASLSGGQFEIEFMQQMIRHHRKAVIEGLHCVDRAYHPELVEMCSSMVDAQMAEIRLMQNWLCVWYGICKKSPV